DGVYIKFTLMLTNQTTPWTFEVGTAPALDPVAGDVTLRCDPSGITALPGTSSTSTCTFRSEAKVPITVKNIVLTAPSGWTPSTTYEGAQVAGQILTISNGPTIQPGDSDGESFLVSLKPTAC